MNNRTDSSRNQQLLDYAVENIKEWHQEYNFLRSDSSAAPLFFTKKNDGWDIGKVFTEEWIGNFEQSFHAIEGRLGKTDPQVITKDEWLAEIKRKQQEKPMILERDKEYDVKLTGKEIAWLYFVTARGNTSDSLYHSLRSQFGELGGIPASKTNGEAWDHSYRGRINAWYDELFPKPETEDQRKLRELKEKHEELGKAIEAMEKK